MSGLSDRERRKLEKLRDKALGEHTEAMIDSFLTDYPAFYRRHEELNRQYNAAVAELNRKWDARVRAQKARGQTPPNVNKFQRQEKVKLWEWYKEQSLKLDRGATSISKPPETTAYPAAEREGPGTPPRGYYKKMREQAKRDKGLQRKMPAKERTKAAQAKYNASARGRKH